MFVLSMETDNAAFEEPEHEVARLLKAAATEVLGGSRFGHLTDVNGNRVGSFALVGE